MASDKDGNEGTFEAVNCLLRLKLNIINIQSKLIRTYVSVLNPLY
jgi:hypothetical protein